MKNMTTLVGIKAYRGKKGIILASDLSGTKTTWDSQGDVAYRKQEKSDVQKIYINNNKNVAVGSAGSVDEAYLDFMQRIKDNTIDMKEVLENGFFPEFKDLHLYRWGGEEPNTGNMNSLLIASRVNNKLGLYTCAPLGKITEWSGWTALGSGRDYALKNITDKLQAIPRSLTLRKGIDLTVESLEKASQDIYTSGLDLVVLTSRNIQEFGKKIKGDAELAKKNSIMGIKKQI